MTEPSEEINEELSTDELKSVSGGFILQNGKDPTGSGSGMTRRDYDKRFGSIDRGPNVGFDVGPIGIRGEKDQPLMPNVGFDVGPIGRER